MHSPVCSLLLASGCSPAPRCGPELSRRGRLGRGHAGRPRRSDRPGHQPQCRRARARSRRRSSASGPRIVVFEVGGVIDLGLTTIDDQRAVPDHRRPDRAVAGHHHHPRRDRHRDARRDHPPHPHPQRRLGPGAAQRLGGGRHLHGRRAQRHRRPLHDHLGASTRTSPPRARASPATRVEEWRRGTSHNITFSYNILAEGLADASHPKGEHQKGSLIHDNATGILIYRNLYAHNYERSPMLKGGVHAAVVNNFIFNPGAQAIHYNLMDLEWGDQPHQLGELSAVGNVLRGGFSTRDGHRLPDDRRRRRPALSRPRQYRGRPAGASRCRCSAATRPARRGSSKSTRPVIWPRGLPCCPPTRSRPMCCASPAPGPGTATRTTSASSSTSPKGAARSSTTSSEVGGYPQVDADPRAVRRSGVGPGRRWSRRSGRYPGQRDDFIQQPTTARDLRDAAAMWRRRATAAAIGMSIARLRDMERAQSRLDVGHAREQLALATRRGIVLGRGVGESKIIVARVRARR